MFLGLKIEEDRVSGPILRSPRAIFFVRPGVGHIELKLGVCFFKNNNNDFSEIDPGTYTKGWGVQETRVYRDLSRF